MYEQAMPEQAKAVRYKGFIPTLRYTLTSKINPLETALVAKCIDEG